MALFNKGGVLDNILDKGVTIINDKVKDIKPIKSEVEVSQNTWVGIGVVLGLILFFKPIKRMLGL